MATTLPPDVEAAEPAGRPARPTGPRNRKWALTLVIALFFVWGVPGLEVSLWGQNLIDAHHVEMTDPFLQGIEIDVPRSAYLRVSWEFD